MIKCGFIISSSAICPRMIFSLKHDIRISRKVSKSRLGDRQDIRLLSSQESLSARFLSPLCFVVFVPSTHRLILAPSFFPKVQVFYRRASWRGFSRDTDVVQVFSPLHLPPERWLIFFSALSSLTKINILSPSNIPGSLRPTFFRTAGY